MKERSDCGFVFFTKRICRAEKCLPPDWGGGYPNVTVGCTVENRAAAQSRMPLFRAILYANPYINIYNLQIGDEVCIPARVYPKEGMPVDK